jgi:tetratricopeptide (TPR) repeat protein
MKFSSVAVISIFIWALGAPQSLRAGVADGEISRLHAAADGRSSDARKSDAFFSLGEIYLERSRTQEALNYYQSSLHYARSARRKLRALRRLSDTYYSQGSLGKAIEFAKDAVAAAPRDVSAQKKLAHYYVEADLRIPALEEYKKILSRRPDDVDTLLGAAGVFESLGLYADAIEHYKKAMVRGASGDVILRVAGCYEIVSERVIAEALLKEYLAATPDYGGFIQLGKLYYASGQYARAVTAFSSAVKMNPRGPDALLRLGMAYYKSSRPDEAAEIFKIYLLEMPDSSAARFFLGLSLELSGESSRASTEYAAALKLSGHDSVLSAVAGALKTSVAGTVPR